MTLSLRASEILRLALTLAIAGAGGWCFFLLGMPAAWLSGGMVFVAAVTLAGVRTVMPDQVRDGLFVVIGITMGAGVQPDVVERIGEWPISMAVLMLVVLLVTLAGYAVLRCVGRWSKETAYFGAIPGALSYVIALAVERHADLPRIASTQSVRLFILVVILPYAIVSSGTGHLQEVASQAGSIRELLIGMPLCLLGSWIAVKVRLPGGWLTGSFFTSAVLNAAGVLNLHLPDVVLIPCFIAIGGMIGARFNNMNLREFTSVLGASVAAFAAAFSVSVLGAALIAWGIGIPFGQALLAYAPGGLDVMMLLAFILDLDPAFVAAHQIVRLTGMILLLPFITGLVLGKRR